jgi:hypothetical protein
MRKQRSGRKREEFYRKFDPFSIIEVDTILISSRHMYRMPYSLHEKSGLASVLIDPGKVMDFEKWMADPEKLSVSGFRFLDSSACSRDEAKRLIIEAFDYRAEEEGGEDYKEAAREFKKREFEIPETALPEEFFPPCIKEISKGIPDGKKRAVFILINFLSSVGWGEEEIENYLIEWNRKNNEALREVYWKGQLRYHAANNKKILPPNCENKGYYADMGVCKRDGLCRKIKNPVNYAKLRARMSAENKPKKKKKDDKGKKAENAAPSVVL